MASKHSAAWALCKEHPSRQAQCALRHASMRAALHNWETCGGALDVGGNECGRGAPPD